MAKAHETDGAPLVSLVDPAATQAFAARLAPLAKPGDVIALVGDLGAGKTTFARGFVNALATMHGMQSEEVPSPTFTLVQSYEFPSIPVYHFDLFRIEQPAEAYELGIEDAFADGVSLIEWPDRLATLLPADRLEITFLTGGRGAGSDVRRARVVASETWRQRIDEGVLHG